MTNKEVAAYAVKNAVSVKAGKETGKKYTTMVYSTSQYYNDAGNRIVVNVTVFSYPQTTQKKAVKKTVDTSAVKI